MSPLPQLPGRRAAICQMPVQKTVIKSLCMCASGARVRVLWCVWEAELQEEQKGSSHCPSASTHGAPGCFFSETWCSWLTVRLPPRGLSRAEAREAFLQLPESSRGRPCAPGAKTELHGSVSNSLEISVNVQKGSLGAERSAPAVGGRDDDVCSSSSTEALGPSLRGRHRLRILAPGLKTLYSWLWTQELIGKKAVPPAQRVGS